MVVLKITKDAVQVGRRTYAQIDLEKIQNLCMFYEAGALSREELIKDIAIWLQVCNQDAFDKFITLITNKNL